VPDSQDLFPAELPKSRPLHSIPSSDQRLLIASALSIAIIEHADDAIIAKMLDGTVLTWNAVAKRAFGYSAAEMIGGLLHGCFCPIDCMRKTNALRG
jgi:PAS domain-containing protein